jgi:hypothetical protein
LRSFLQSAEIVVVITVAVASQRVNVSTHDFYSFSITADHHLSISPPSFRLTCHLTMTTTDKQLDNWMLHSTK